ncbi:MAG: hypothetical protein QHH15_01090, partial [Candidatus Thermoplasmatota archaeon]|nr:hypothetical protein [Candidatus Thermoplasmatota archaeon]
CRLFIAVFSFFNFFTTMGKETLQKMKFIDFLIIISKVLQQVILMVMVILISLLQQESRIILVIFGLNKI